MSTTKPTPSEAARAMAEAWDSRNLLPAFIKDDLVARLTPVFERAQASDELRDVNRNLADYGEYAHELEMECDALRERAERAEAYESASADTAQKSSSDDKYILVIHFNKRVVHRIGEACPAKVCP